MKAYIRIPRWIHGVARTGIVLCGVLFGMASAGCSSGVDEGSGTEPSQEYLEYDGGEVAAEACEDECSPPGTTSCLLSERAICEQSTDGCQRWSRETCESGVCEKPYDKEAYCRPVPEDAGLGEHIAGGYTYDWDVGLSGVSVFCLDGVWEIEGRTSTDPDVSLAVMVWDSSTRTWPAGYWMESEGGEYWHLKIGQTVAGFGCDDEMAKLFGVVAVKGQTMSDFRFSGPRGVITFSQMNVTANEHVDVTVKTQGLVDEVEFIIYDPFTGAVHATEQLQNGYGKWSARIFFAELPIDWLTRSLFLGFVARHQGSPVGSVVL